MELDTIKKIIKEKSRGLSGKISRIRKAELYYENRNDILRKKILLKIKQRKMIQIIR